MNIIPRKFYIDDLFDDVFDREVNKMKCDIYEKDGIYHLEMDIPGFSKEDIKIECDNANLTITAEKEKNNDNEDKKYLKRERFYGKYSRSFYLGDVDSDNIDASFHNGILTIKVPKAEEKETKKYIEIK